LEAGKIVERVMRLSEQELNLIELSLKAVKKDKVCLGDIPEQAEALLKRIKEIK
jgi:hypothetical protein